jgi:hypothetical protein
MEVGIFVKIFVFIFFLLFALCKAQINLIPGVLCVFYPKSIIKSTQIPAEIRVILSNEGVFRNYFYFSGKNYKDFIQKFKFEKINYLTEINYLINKINIKIIINYPNPTDRSDIIDYQNLRGGSNPSLLQSDGDIRSVSGGCLVFSQNSVPRKVINISKSDYLSIREKPSKSSREVLRVKVNDILWKMQQKFGDWINIEFVNLERGNLVIKSGYVYKKYLSLTYKR